MIIVVSDQDTGGLSVIKIKRRGDRLTIKPKNEMMTEGRENYVQQAKRFTFKSKTYLALGRKNGMIQLYEDVSHQNRSFKLYKEWKNANMNPSDSIISIGFINKQYLYSCSNEGKLVLRDLVNDDEDNSYKVFLINTPVSDVEISYLPMYNKLLIAGAGKNNELKLYEIRLKNGEEEDDDEEEPLIESSEIRSTLSGPSTFPRGTRLRRRSTLLNLRSQLYHNERQVKALVPFWVSSSHYKDYIYKSSSLETISNWIVSICFATVEQDEIIICGTQFGKLLIYNIMEESYPFRTFELSQFAIVSLKIFNQGRFLIFADSMSKVGILNLTSMQMVSFYNNLKIGPVLSLEFALSHAHEKTRKSSHVASFDPIYVTCSLIDKRIHIYKLYDDGTAELVLDIGTPALVPCFCIIDRKVYENLHQLTTNEASRAFEQPNQATDIKTKKRRYDTSNSQDSGEDEGSAVGRLDRISANSDSLFSHPLLQDSTIDDANDKNDSKDHECINEGLKSINLIC